MKNKSKKSKGERLGWKLGFKYCVSEIEDRKRCTEQCDHCKEYYKELEDEKERN